MEPRQSYFNTAKMNKLVKKCKGFKDRQDLVEFMRAWTDKATICTEKEQICEMELNLAYKAMTLFPESQVITLVENARFALTMED